MPTAQAITTKSTQNKNTKVDNKIANAVAKVEETTNTTVQEQTQSAGASTTGNKTPQEQPEFIKQSLIIIEKKVRNLEKRRSKLDEYKESQRKGASLNEDQLAAISKYDEVIRSLELARELEKQFVSLANDAMKQQKKQAKKELLEREETVKERLKEAQKISSLLDTFGNEVVRNDFLNETNGAIRLTEQELNMLDEFNKLVQPTELGTKLDQAANEAAEHLLNLIEGKNKLITQFNPELTGTVSYNDLKKLFERIFNSPYWTRELQQQQEQQTEHTEEQAETQQPQQQETQENLHEQLNNLNLNEQQQQQQVAEQVNQQQQSTSEDYVLVNSNDFTNDNTQSKFQQQTSPSQQHQQTKAFFTTLNPTSNINEFLQNNGEGINFLQDSEIQQQQQQQQQQSSDNFNHVPQQSNQQEFTPNEGQRENRGGNRGGHREFNGNRNYDQRRNYEPRRSGGGGGNYQPRGDNNAPRNGGGSGYRGGNRGGYRGGYSNSGPRNNSGSNQYRQPRQDSHHHQQSVAQN